MPDICVVITDCAFNESTGKLAVQVNAVDLAGGNHAAGLLVDIETGLSASLTNQAISNAAKLELQNTFGVVFGPTDKAMLFGGVNLV